MPQEKYRVYEWSSVEWLRQHELGVAIAIAISKNEAIKKISRILEDEVIEPSNEKYMKIKDLIKELTETDPTICEIEDYVYWNYGGA
jgi:hypothetical protein